MVSVKVGGRQLTGRVVAASADGVSLDVGGERVEAAFTELGPGRVQVEFARIADLTDEEIGPEITDGDDAADTAVTDSAVTDTAVSDSELEDET